MKKTFLSVIISIAMLFLIFPISVGAMTIENTVEYLDAPSETFIDLYTEVFRKTSTFEVYDRNGNRITNAFVTEFYDNFVNSDFTTIWNGVAENGYILKYGKPQYVQNESQPISFYTPKTAYSEWTYVLEDLDELLKGKRVEFIYRVVGEYTTNGSIITGYTYPPKLELNMTFPGTLFPYTTSTNSSVEFNSDHTEIYFNLSLTITFQYNYSAAIWQTIGPYTATAVGTAE